MPEETMRPSNECDCGHLLGAHGEADDVEVLPCTICKTCFDYHHTPGFVPKNANIVGRVLKQRQVTKATPRFVKVPPPSECVGFQCYICGATKTAKRMNGNLRWHIETDGRKKCHKCYEKARLAVADASQ